MATNGITLDQDAVTTAVSTAIVQQLSNEHRDEILAQAIQYLVTPQGDGYSYGRTRTTPMQDAVNNAVGLAAQQVAHEIVLNDEQIQAQLRSALKDAVVEALNDMTAVREAVGSAIAGLLRRADQADDRY